MRKSVFQPSVEGMERKLALSGVTASFADGHLLVEGTKGDDEILLSVDFEQVRVFEKVDGEYQPVPIDGAATLLLGAVEGIRVEGGKGDDSIVLGGTAEIPAEIGGKEIVLDGGQGDDTLAAYPFLSAQPGTTGSLRLLGGQGRDELSYLGYTVGAVDLVLEGGKDDDAIDVAMTVFGGGHVRIEAGPGDDVISAALAQSPDETGTGSLEIEDGPGEDTVLVP